MVFSGEMREKVLREVIIAAKMRSPYIVQYNSPWTENINNNNAEGVTESSKSESTSTSKSVIDETPASGHVLYIPMELCGIQIGGKVIRTLKDAIIRINNELNQKMGDLITNMGAFIASRFIEEMVSGVDYLHSLKPPIIHRDLKPSNVFLTDGNGGIYLKIGDLGSATYHGDTNDLMASTSIELEHTCHKGTYEYMAPEVRNSSLYTEKCDAFSLGRIIMDLFCIEKPESDGELNK
jgi:serine/threonine protein kinase